MTTANLKEKNGTYCNYEAVHKALDAADYLRSQGLESPALLVLVCLARHHNKVEGQSWPSYSTIMQETLLGKSSISRAVSELEGIGLVIRETGNYRKSTRYKLQWSQVELFHVGTSPDVEHPSPDVEHPSPDVEHSVPPGDRKYLREDVNGRRKTEDVNTYVDGRMTSSFSTTGETGQTEEHPGDPVSASSGQTSPVTPHPAPQGSIAAPVTFPDSPAGRVAEHLWQSLQCPATHRVSAATSWVTALDECLKHTAESRAIKVITWACQDTREVTGDEFPGWSAVLAGAKDPCAYLCHSFRKIEGGWDRATRIAARLARQSSSTPLTPLEVSSETLQSIAGRIASGAITVNQASNETGWLIQEGRLAPPEYFSIGSPDNNYEDSESYICAEPKQQDVVREYRTRTGHRTIEIHSVGIDWDGELCCLEQLAVDQDGGEQEQQEVALGEDDDLD